MMHTGRIVSGRPTLGAWVNYALGSENENLPAYVVLRNDSSLPTDGTRNWSSGFLPPQYQGVHFRHTGTPVLYLQPTTAVSDRTQSLRRDLLQTLNAVHRAEHSSFAPDLEARIASYEMAGRMQLSAGQALEPGRGNGPDAGDVRHRPAQDRQLRPPLPDRPPADRAGRAVRADFRRRRKSGTRTARTPKTPRSCCEQTDQPTAALLTDLKRRGLLE